MRVTYLWSIILLGSFLGTGGVHAQTKKFSEAELKFPRAFAWLGYSWTGRAVVMSFTDFSRLSR
jgi:hypothetical protein